MIRIHDSNACPPCQDMKLSFKYLMFSLHVINFCRTRVNWDRVRQPNGRHSTRFNATGVLKAPDAVDWFFNGEPISDIKPEWFGRILQLNRKPMPGRSFISELVIKRVTMDDRGQYACRLAKKLAQGFNVHILNGMQSIFTSHSS
ncbi:hypothetical protein DPMN_117059 [Dreissena polymorpha]|uniref:Ig-like domain-containing protein n=1 Tax=Dreissena polymorpha TaxID=45954 RepID=A0A9D4QU38_DREPO|nr:hypothetical protein DPMN_117059 [Dreissena polymorpha]